MSRELIETGVSLINKDLNLEENELGVDISSREELVLKLTKIIDYLLNKDFERLLAAFYRIDLSEKIVTKILHESPPETISRALAEKVIERELLKAQYRIKYRG